MMKRMKWKEMKVSKKIWRFLAGALNRGGSRRKYWGEGKTKSWRPFLVVALKTQAKTTKSTTPTLQKRPLYNCLLVLPLHIAAVSKDLGTRLRFGGAIAPFCGNVKRAWPLTFRHRLFYLCFCLLCWRRCSRPPSCYECAKSLSSLSNVLSRLHLSGARCAVGGVGRGGSWAVWADKSILLPLLHCIMCDVTDGNHADVIPMQLFILWCPPARREGSGVAHPPSWSPPVHLYVNLRQLLQTQ